MAGRRIERGELRLVRFPSPDKVRPVVVLTRQSVVSRLSKITVAPITSSIRGVAAEVVLDVADGLKQRCCVNLHNILTIRQTQIGRRVGQLSGNRMLEVCAALNYACGCDECLDP